MQKVCIQGLGFVGAVMSTAVALASDSNGPIYDVIGVDLPNKLGNKRVQSINQSCFPFKTNDAFLESSFKKVCSQGNLRATTDQSVFAEARVIIVDINLDISFLEDKPNLKLEHLIDAIKTIGRYIQPESLLLIETTVPPGTCEKVIAPTLFKELKKRQISKESVYLAHSYERVMPGKNYLKSIIDFPRVFSGLNSQSADACEVFLKQILNVKRYPLTKLSSTTASETAKVLENSYRATNIAFIDEWTKFSEEVGIDLFEIIHAIKQRPTHSNIMFPGLGVGGYCLTKDPTFTPAAAKELFGKDLYFPFSKLAVKTNNSMPMHTISRLSKLLGNNLRNKNVLICGVTYRADIEDTRYSASETLVKELLRLETNITCHDPYIEYWEEMNIDVLKELPELKSYDAIVLAVAHEDYKHTDCWNEANLILDANMVFNSQQIKSLTTAGLNIKSIGRGDNL